MLFCLLKTEIGNYDRKKWIVNLVLIMPILLEKERNMQHNDEIAGFSRKDEQLDIKDILFKILSKWYWFAICGFLGLSIGWVVNRYSLLIWQVETTIMVSDASKKPGIDNLFDRFSLAPKINLQNHIELLKSYSLNRMTIENLGWRTSWFAKGTFIDSEF